MWFYIILIYFLLMFLPLFLPETFKFRYHACFISYALLYIFLAFVYIACYFFKKDSTNYCIKKLIMKFAYVVYGIKIDEKGLENVDTETKGIILTNHQSSLDGIIICQIFWRCRSCTCVARKELSYIGPFGLALILRNYIFIDRQNKDSAIKSLSQNTDKFFKKFKNGKIIVFPEGTRNKIGGEFLEFKKGAFFLAVEKQVPIIPVVISPLKFIKRNEYFKKGRVIVSYLKPIPTEGMTSEDVDVLIEKTKKLMNEEYQKLHEEV